MKKRVIALMIFIPLMLMLTVFSVGKAVSLVVDIPVSGIHITTQTSDGILSLDMADYQDNIFITAEVEPLNAKNKNYTYQITGVESEAPADITIDENSGLLMINGTGAAKITVVSTEGGYTDSIIVNTYSSKVLNLEPTLLNAIGENIDLTEVTGEDYQYTANILSGIYRFHAGIFPNNLSDSNVEWSSSDSNIFELNSITGKGKAMLSGSVDITLISDNTINDDVKSIVRLNVTPEETQSGITINGGENLELLCSENAEYAEFLVEGRSVSEMTLSGSGMGGVQSYTIAPLNESETQLKVRLKLNYGHADVLPITVSSTDGNNTISLVFAAATVDIFTAYHMSSNNTIIHKKNSSINYVAISEPYDDNITYVWSIENPNILSLEENGGICTLTALSEGETTLTVSAYNGSGIICASVTKTIKSVTPIYSIQFVDNAKTYGIENILTIGSKKLQGGLYVEDRTELAIKILTDEGLVNYTGKYLNFDTSDDSIITPYVTLTAFKVNSVGTGSAEICAEWQYADYFKESTSATMTLRSVYEGVNVATYEELDKATEEGKQVILKDNIMLGKENATAEELKAMAKTMPTTYDWQFYKNKGLSRPEVYYLIEFKNDVYGNGYSICGEYFTKAADSTGMPLLFKGPLDFVAIATASVKAQDNIVFLVRTDGVTINNVVLEGCTDKSLIKDGEYDLSCLNYTGTTLEIASDANIKNSRISNGRNVVRIYAGDVTLGSPVMDSFDNFNASDERINVTIESCIMTSAREFIVKIGSNRTVKSSGDSESTFEAQKFTKENGSEYDPFDPANSSDDYFNNKYLINDVTLKNSVLATSGLFAIGIETHFAGPLLAGFASAKIINWTELAGTSFACALHFVGDVKLLDWKNLSNVDSSTLIETTGNHKPFLTLDISAMLEKVYQTNLEYADVISEIEGKSYLHGGIASYGGGYNYSYIDFDNFTSEQMEKYRINLSILAEGRVEDINDTLYMQGTMLPLAAGYSDFVFYMYNRYSQNDYTTQRQLIESGSAYVIPIAE